MNDDEQNDELSNKINAAANLVKAIPVYQDALQPIMQETGKALGTVGQVVNAALAPIRGVVWGANQVESWVSEKVAAKLGNEPSDNIQTPDLTIAGPTIEALKFSGHKPELSDMFASLLASAMRKDKSSSTHPAFVDKIRHMSSLDAKIFKELSKKVAIPTIDILRNNEGSEGKSMLHSFVRPEFILIAAQLTIPLEKQFSLVQSSLENLDRLGLISCKSGGHLTSKENLVEYEKMIRGPFIKPFIDKTEDGVFRITAVKSYILVTQIGKNFSDVVFVKDEQI